MATHATNSQSVTWYFIATEPLLLTLPPTQDHIFMVPWVALK